MSFTDKEKEAIIEELLKTDDSKTCMAYAMANIIPSYTEIGRKILKMDETIKEEMPDPINSRFDILDL